MATEHPFPLPPPGAFSQLVTALQLRGWKEDLPIKVSWASIRVSRATEGAQTEFRHSPCSVSRGIDCWRLSVWLPEPWLNAPNQAFTDCWFVGRG